MSKGKAQRLNERRHKGPSQFEGLRGPKAWEKTNFPLRKTYDIKTGVKDPNRFVRLRERRYIVD